MMTDLPPLVTGETGQGLIITPTKKLIIRALRATFTSMYPNDKLSSMNIDMEYPYKEEHYPGIWVRFSPSKVQASGLEPTQRTDSEIFSVWYFEGTVSFTIIALSSKERDLISDGVIEAYAFASQMPSASPFYATIFSSDLINMSLQSDVLTPGGQSETIGTPWDDDKIAYEDRYSFEVVGQVRSRVQAGVVFTNLSEIQVSSTITNVTGAPDNTVVIDDGNGTWQ
jgi:hypothetical protein